MRVTSARAFASLSLALTLAPGFAGAQDAARGAALYRELPGQPALGSCISCHGEPINNRNSVLRGAAGPALISKTIAAVARMGYLRNYLTDADLGDVAAYLASVVPAGSVDSLPEPWPTADEFGAQLVGTQSPPRAVLIRNLQPRGDIAIGAVLSSDEAAFPIQHDCPLSLPPFGQCTAMTSFRPQSVGPASARFTIVDTGGRELRVGILNGTGAAAAPAALAWSSGTPTLVDFGRISLGQVARRELVLINTSAAAVALATLRVTGPNASRFTLDTTCALGGTLEGRTTCTVTLGFAPSIAGRAEGWVEVVSDASNAPLVRIAAAGVAASPAPPSASAPGGGSITGSGGGSLSPYWVAMLLLAVIALRIQSRH